LCACTCACVCARAHTLSLSPPLPRSLSFSLSLSLYLPPSVCLSPPLREQHNAKPHRRTTRTGRWKSGAWPQSQNRPLLLVWHGSCHVFRCATWYDVNVTHFICVTWLMYMCVVTHVYVWQDWCICGTWLMHMCDIIQMCDMTPAHVWHGMMSTWLIS